MRRWKIDEDGIFHGEWAVIYLLVSLPPALDVRSPSLPPFFSSSHSSRRLTRPTAMSDDEQHNHNFEQVRHLSLIFHRSPRSPPSPNAHVPPHFLGQRWGLGHLPHAMLGPSQERSRRHQGYVLTFLSAGRCKYHYAHLQAAPARSSTCPPPRRASTVTLRFTWSPSMYV